MFVEKFVDGIDVHENVLTRINKQIATYIRHTTTYYGPYKYFTLSYVYGRQFLTSEDGPHTGRSHNSRANPDIFYVNQS